MKKSGKTSLLSSHSWNTSQQALPIAMDTLHSDTPQIQALPQVLYFFLNYLLSLNPVTPVTPGDTKPDPLYTCQ